MAFENLLIIKFTEVLEPQRQFNEDQPKTDDIKVGKRLSNTETAGYIQLRMNN